MTTITTTQGDLGGHREQPAHKGEVPVQFDYILADDEQMPAGKDWLFIRHDRGQLMVLRRGALGSPAMVHSMWAAIRAGMFAPPEVHLRAV